jgi:hypothetical protein
MIKISTNYKFSAMAIIIIIIIIMKLISTPLARVQGGELKIHVFYTSEIDRCR